MPFTSTDEARNVVPEAEAKPNHTVEVAAVLVPLVIVSLVKMEFVENRLVDVTAVAVPFVKVRAPSDVAPITVNVEVTVELAAIYPP
jgi:hypothetical protein